MNDDTTVSGDVQPDSAAVAASTEETTEPKTVEAPEGAEAKADENEGKKPDTAKEDEAASEAAKTLSKRKQTMQERLNEVTHARREAERKSARLEAELAQLKGKMKAPVAEEYDDVGKLTADQVNHTLDKRRVSELEAEHKDTTEEVMKARAIAWTARVEDFSPTVTDFESVVRSAPLDDKTSEMVVDLDEGPQVAYHLGKNHAEARRISALPPLEKAVALGRLVERLTSPPPKKITQAAAPIESVGGKSSGGAEFNPAKASVEDFSERYRRLKELGA